MSAASASSDGPVFKEREDASMNQYWYSPSTISTLVTEVELQGTRVAFLSCPSLFFSLKNASVRAASRVFEFDRRWAADPGFVFYDFNAPESVPVDCWDSFDMVVIDPPFITKEVWTKYVQTAKLIGKKQPMCKLLFTSVLENHEMLEELIDDPMFVAAFQPSIPHLTYQYHCFVNYPLSGVMSAYNPELPREDARTRANRETGNDLRESEIAFTIQARTRMRDGEEVLPALVRMRQRQLAQAAASHAGGSAGGSNPLLDAPISGMKWNHVPAGLTEYAGGAAEPPAAVAAAPKSAAYEQLASRRNLMEEYKKLVDDIVKHITKIITFRQAHGGDAAVVPAALAEPRDAALVRMRAIADDLAARDAADANSVCRVIRSCADAYATADGMTPAAFREMCADATRLYKSPVFNRQKELLAAMKVESKQAATSATAESASATS